MKKNSIENSNGGIGIVPYIYEEAKQYFYTIYQAQEVNKNQDEVSSKFYETQTVVITPPERKCKPPKFFSL